MTKRERAEIIRMLEENPYGQIHGVTPEQSLLQVLNLALYQSYKAGRIHGWREREEKIEQDAKRA